MEAEKKEMFHPHIPIPLSEMNYTSRPWKAKANVCLWWFLSSKTYKILRRLERNISAKKRKKCFYDTDLKLWFSGILDGDIYK